MSVQVTVNGHAAFLEKPADHQLRVPHGGIALSHHGPVLPVQILAGQGTTIVADYYAVRVQHRHQLEDESLSQLLSDSVRFVQLRVECGLKRHVGRTIRTWREFYGENYYSVYLAEKHIDVLPIPIRGGAYFVGA